MRGHTNFNQVDLLSIPYTVAVARALIGGGGGGVFIYSCSAQLISLEINLNTSDFKRN